MDFASQRDPMETELSVLMTTAPAKLHNVSLPPRIDQKQNQLITDFDDAEDDVELKLNETGMIKNQDQDLLHTSRRLLSKQQDEVQYDSANQSTLLDIDFSSQFKKFQSPVLEPNQSWLFGIYLRYVIWPRCSLLMALYVSVTFDILSLVYQSLLFVPLISDGGRQIFSASLSLCLLQMVFQVVSVKLFLQMIAFRHFKIIPTILHILRLATFAVVILQIVFHRKVMDISVPLSQVNSVYPAVWTLQVCYQPFAIWVGISVRYWIIVMGTKQRILLLLHNKVPTNEHGIGVKIQVVPKVQLERSSRLDQEEQQRVIIANRIHQIRVMKREKTSRPRSNYRRKIATQTAQIDREDQQFEAAAGGRAYSIPNSNQQEQQMIEFYKKQKQGSEHSQTSTSILSHKKPRESIRVCIRVRPVLQYERSRGEAIYYPQTSGNDNLDAIKVADGQNIIESKFDQVFRQTSHQSEIYNFVKDCVTDVTNGFNSTIFAYGQTGSGKTFTMFGPHWDDTSTGTQNTLGPLNSNFDEFYQDRERFGIIPRAIEQIFQTLSIMCEMARPQGYNSRYEDPPFVVYCSFLQIYNEKLYDLLQDKKQDKPLVIREDKHAGIFVEGQSEYVVTNANDCFKLLKRGEQSRITRQTSSNIHSSRSHTIFQLLIESTQPDPQGMLFRGKLNLCDLAGSEKIHKGEAMTQQHMLELKTINLSLSCLGKVIQSLAQDKKNSFIVYRDSKLTRLLQDSLGGNTRTTLIAAVSPLVDHSEETISTLKFADRAKKILQKVSANQISAADDALVLKLQREIQHLKDILNLKRKGGAQDLHQQLLSLKEENSHLRQMVQNTGDAERLKLQNTAMKQELLALKQQSPRSAQLPLAIQAQGNYQNYEQASPRQIDDGFFALTETDQFQGHKSSKQGAKEQYTPAHQRTLDPLPNSRPDVNPPGASKSSGPYYKPPKPYQNNIPPEYLEMQSDASQSVNAKLQNLNIKYQQIKETNDFVNESPSLNMSSVSYADQNSEQDQKQLTQIKPIAQNSIKGTLVNNGRCPKCTLKPPCKHYLSNEELNADIALSQRSPPRQQNSMKPPLAISSGQSTLKQADSAFENLMRAGQDPITQSLVQSYLKRQGQSTHLEPPKQTNSSRPEQHPQQFQKQINPNPLRNSGYEIMKSNHDLNNMNGSQPSLIQRTQASPKRNPFDKLYQPITQLQDDLFQLPFVKQEFQPIQQQQQQVRTKSLAMDYNRMASHQQRHMKQNPHDDIIQVRYRDRNNFLQVQDGSITRTTQELLEERKRKAELSKAGERLKQLEKLEEYRERKMLQEMEQLEMERMKEEGELKEAYMKELKYNKYLEQQREKLQEHKSKQSMDEVRKRRKEEDLKKKEKDRLSREAKEHEQKKKMIADYKQKKLITEELLANADLDSISQVNENYGVRGGFEDDAASNEDDADAIMNQMIEQYSGLNQQHRKKPPAVL